MNAYDIEGNAVDTAFSLIGEHRNDIFDMSGLRIGFDRDWLANAASEQIAEISISGTRQGGCTDGEYIYQTSGDTDYYTSMTIIKYKIADGTYTTKTFSGTPNFGHANDMAYNPNTGYLYVCTMLSDGSVIVLDASDLSYVETIYLKNASNESYKVWQFCYNRWEDCYYSAYSNNYLVYNNEWEYVKTIEMPSSQQATAQGCETDGQYIYRLTYNPNYIDVAKVDGTYVTTINLSTGGHEPEAIMCDWNGKFYVSTHQENIARFFGVKLFN